MEEGENKTDSVTTTYSTISKVGHASDRNAQHRRVMEVGFLCFYFN
jgi:hypothetical protein